MAKDLQLSLAKMKTPWSYDEILVQLAIENKASLQRLAQLIAKFEAAARRDCAAVN
jgi:hypothetical protein